MSFLYAPLRNAIVTDPVLAAGLSTWAGEPACFTRRPIPDDREHIFCIINPPDVSDIDALNSRRDQVAVMVAFYGVKAMVGDPADQTRSVDDLAEYTREKFHRNKWAIQSDAFEIIDIVATGPFVGPVDDDKEIARIVNLRMRLGRTQ